MEKNISTLWMLNPACMSQYFHSFLGTFLSTAAISGYFAEFHKQWSLIKSTFKESEMNLNQNIAEEFTTVQWQIMLNINSVINVLTRT